jgi:alpha-tubulin suppressor-like RCC1 family protein
MISAQVFYRDIPTAAETELRFTSIGAAEWQDPVYTFSRFDRTHTCGLATSRDIYCWGNYTGATGRMPGDRQWGLLSVGARHNCALTTGGEAYCWGQADEGQVGGPTTDQCRRDPTHAGLAPCAINPVPVAGGRTYSRISAGTAHSCALTQAGAAFCWGRNSSGQLGDGGTTQAGAPVAVQGAPAFVDISAGGNHTCARTAAGTVYCWGAGNAGQLGNGSTANSSTPVQVAGSYASLSAGWMHTCALRADGAAFCWGANELGQLGTGGTTSSPTPAAVTGGIAFASVSAGGRHSCGVRASDSAAFCWGDNGGGKLGFGLGASRATPRPVRNP